MSNDYPRRVRDVLASQNKRSISIILTNTGPSSEASGGNHVVDIGADDYNEDTKTIAHTFAVATIDESQNTYKPSNQYQQTSLLNGNGYPAAISDDFEDDYYLGKETVGADGKAMFVNLSDSDLLNINIIKGKATATDDSSRNYIDLLAEVNRSNGEQSNSQLSINVERATLNVNSNASNSKFVVEGILEDESNIGKLTIQSLKGKHRRIPSYADLENNTANPSQNGYTVKPNQLKNIGSQLPLMASGEIYIPNDINDPAEFGKALAGALVPGIARSGAARVSAKGMQPASTLNRVTNGDFSKDTSVSDLDTDDTLSYGNYNNWLIPFEGRDEFIMPMLGIQILALGFICEAAAELIKLEIPGNQRNVFMARFYKGFLITFGLKAPMYTDSKTFREILLKALTQAVLSSTGLGPAGNFVKLNNEFFNNPWKENPGWIIMQVRSIMRKIGGDVVRLIDIGGEMSNLLVKNKGDSAGLYSNTTKAIFNSNIFNIIRKLASIGASAAKYTNLPDAGLRIVPNVGREYLNIDNSDSVTFDPAIIPKASKLISQIKLNRDYGLGSGRAQAIANASIRSKLLLPNTLNTATIYASGDQNQLTSLTSDAMSGYVNSEDNRLDIEDVKSFEEYLNSSYMPFYFHDLRTNEIVAFHAFLNNMSDNFSVDWQNNSAYGRVEPVYQYTGTTRELQVDFYILATNELDHSRMWAKINKLVTLVYPQYTKGRALETTDSKKFIQPFSQIPGGSPVFRIRVGDVWKSNYNRFNAMRLFGLGQPEFDLAQSVINERIRRERERLAREITERIDLGELKTGDEIIISTDTNAISSRIGRIPLPEAWTTVFGNNVAVVETSTWFSWGGGVQGAGIGADGQRKNIAGLLPPTSLLPAGEYTYRVTDSNLESGGRNDGLVVCSMTILNPPAPLLQPFGITSGVSDEAIDILLTSFLGAIGELDNAPGTRREGFTFGNGPIKMRVPLDNLVSFAEDALEGISPSEIVARGEGGLASTVQGINLAINGDLILGLSELLAQITDVNSCLPRRPNPDWLSQEVERQLAPLRAELEQEIAGNETQRRLVREFFNADNNPIMKSFEENGAGGGLAVVCKSMGFDWNDSRWDTNYTEARSNSRAPMWLKVTMGMSVIHDIVPGISADGYMTAPVYPVGPIATVTDKLESIERSETDTRTPNSESS